MKKLFVTLLSFKHFWDFKPTNAIHVDSPGVYISDKVLTLGTIDKIQLKYEAIDGSVVKRIPEPIPFSFVRVKPSAFKVFSEPETIYYKKTTLV